MFTDLATVNRPLQLMVGDEPLDGGACLSHLLSLSGPASKYFLVTVLADSSVVIA